MERVIRDIHVLVVGFLVCGYNKTYLLASSLQVLANCDIHIINARLTDIPRDAYVRQSAI